MSSKFSGLCRQDVNDDYLFCRQVVGGDLASNMFSRRSHNKSTGTLVKKCLSSWRKVALYVFHQTHKRNILESLENFIFSLPTAHSISLSMMLTRWTFLQQLLLDRCIYMEKNWLFSFRLKNKSIKSRIVFS